MTHAPHIPTREPRRSGFWLRNGDWIQYEAQGTVAVTYRQPPRKPGGAPDLSTCRYDVVESKGVL
ncbi:hypothetical protein [EBPR siphovirus 2]|nr:hypothetical protein [EBPR siphovirus 2]